MSELKSGHTEAFLSARSSFGEIFVLAVLASLGVNILSSSMMSSPSKISYVFGSIGAVIILASLVIVAARTVSLLKSKVETSGAIVLQTSDSAILNIPRYRFAEEVHSISKAVFLENAAIESAWNETPLAKRSQDSDHSKQYRILSEIVEYYILSELSLHLSSYFIDVSGADLPETFKREDIPDVLLSNRALDILTRPMEDRAAFSDWKNSKVPTFTITDPKGQLIYAVKTSGEIFSLFRLSLPSGSRVSRPSPNQILIKTRRFNLSISYDISGTNINLPKDFVFLYLGKGLNQVNSFKVVVSMQVEFHLSSILSMSGWAHFRWVDSFMDRIQEQMSLDQFSRQIGWDTAVTLARVNANLEKRRLALGKSKPPAQSSAPKRQAPRSKKSPAKPN